MSAPHGWQIHIAEDFMRMGKTLHAYRYVDFGRVQYLTDSPLVINTEDESVRPSDAGLFLPDDLWRPIVNYLTPPPATDGEIRRLEEALSVERDRVDRSLHRLLPNPAEDPS